MTSRHNTMGGEAFVNRLEYDNSSYLVVTMASIALAATMLGSMYFISRQSQRITNEFSPNIESTIATDSLASRAMDHIGESIKSLESKRITIEIPNRTETPVEDISVEPKVTETIEEVKPEQKAETEKTLENTTKPEQQKPSFQPKDVGFNNKDLTWGFLMDRGYSKEQAAGIMGNLKQEHNFQTSGDGLAQWIGGRKVQLYSYNNPDSINTQLEHMGTELNTRYSQVDQNLRTAQNVEDATRIFQNEYEKCGDCREDKRINYAKQILNEHQ